MRTTESVSKNRKNNKPDALPTYAVHTPQHLNRGRMQRNEQ